MGSNPTTIPEYAALEPSADIITEICDTLVNVFTIAMSASAAEDDPLRLKRCELAPLQDDPTTNAPLVLVMYDPDLGTVPDDLYGPDIGGGGRFVNYIRVVARSPRTKTKRDSLVAIGIMRTRIKHALMKAGLLVGTESADHEEVWFMGPRLTIELQRQRLIGGESEWYAELRVVLSFRTEDIPDWGP